MTACMHCLSGDDQKCLCGSGNGELSKFQWNSVKLDVCLIILDKSDYIQQK